MSKDSDRFTEQFAAGQHVTVQQGEQATAGDTVSHMSPFDHTWQIQGEQDLSASDI